MLQPLRDQIDSLDNEIVTLINKRASVANEIGKIKAKDSAPMYVPSREEKVFQKLSNLNQGPLNNKAIKSIYREIISASISLEKELKIAYLGPEATYTHQAAIKNFGSSLKYVPSSTIKDVFHAVEKDDADYGVIPVENSNEGAVFHSLDMLVESDIKIVAQVYLKINHCLISSGSTNEIETVHSKDQAIGQCRNWLHKNLSHATLTNCESTAKAVTIAKKDPSCAAIASSLAAKLYDVPVIRENIQDNLDNTTRFLIIGKKSSPPVGDDKDKTSIVVSINDKIGALQDALKPLSSRNINLCKIESRPSKKKAWDYYFFIDFCGHYDDLNVQEALTELKANCSFVKWLGSYPNTENS